MTAAMTASEIAGWCIGMWYEDGSWFDEDHSCPHSIELPDVEIGEPMTDAQWGSIMRLREKAIKDDLVMYAAALWDRIKPDEDSHGLTSRGEDELATPSIEQIRDAAIDTLVPTTPKHVQEAWQERNNGSD